ncbi:MAG TPA: FecR family protein, partial [Spirochaetota bacterium]|nr:FecR family protein [Spirochaetota bacterium]
MRLSKSDVIAALSGITILAVLGTLLYYNINRHAGAGSTELIGKLVSKSNLAERKYTAQVVWDEIFKDSDLYNYDTIRTGESAEAVIRLKDGTTITLNENSMILLAYSDKEVDIQFIQGTINAKQTGKNAGDKVVTIASGDSKISLKDSDVSLSQDKDNQFQLTVNRGRARLKTGDQEKIVNENQNILAGKDTIRLYDLTIKLIAPENNRAYAAQGLKSSVNFSWERPAGDYTSYLEIAANPTVSDPFIKRKVPGSAATELFSDGIYYWRVTAVNNATKKVESSETRKFSISSSTPVQLITPSNNSVIKFHDSNPMINFMWSRSESVSRYTLLISSSPTMSSPVIKSLVVGNKISVNSLGQGEYYWKVSTINESDLINTSAESPIYKFQVSRTDKLEPPQPIAPGENKSIHPLTVTQQGVNFTWTKDNSIPETQIIISKDRGFTQTVFKKSIGGNAIRFTEQLSDGDYYWSLRGVMADGSMTDSSPVRRFRIAREGGISLIEPRDKAGLVMKDNETVSDIDFSWSKTELEGKYVLQIANDRGFTSISKELTVQDLSSKVSLKEGLHFWRVRQVDDKGTEMMSSPVFSFELMSTLQLPVALSPKAGVTVDMLKRD